MEIRCIAKAYRGRPLDRIAVKFANGLAYIRNPDVPYKEGMELDGAVGFPEEDVFEEDDVLLPLLRSAFDSGELDALESLWTRAVRLRAMT